MRDERLCSAVFLSNDHRLLMCLCQRGTEDRCKLSSVLRHCVTCGLTALRKRGKLIPVMHRSETLGLAEGSAPAKVGARQPYVT